MVDLSMISHLLTVVYERDFRLKLVHFLTFPLLFHLRLPRLLVEQGTLSNR